MRNNICSACESIVFVHRDIDCEGNIVHSYRCLNGHIKGLHIENFYALNERKLRGIVGKQDDVIAFIGIIS